MIFTEIQNGIVLQNLTDKEQDLIIDICEGKFPTENFLPRPCVYDREGKNFKDYSPRDWLFAFQKAFMTLLDKEDESFINKYGLAEIICLCISCLNARGYNNFGRSEILKRLDEGNATRGVL